MKKYSISNKEELLKLIRDLCRECKNSSACIANDTDKKNHQLPRRASTRCDPNKREE